MANLVGVVSRAVLLVLREHVRLIRAALLGSGVALGAALAAALACSGALAAAGGSAGAGAGGAELAAALNPCKLVSPKHMTAIMHMRVTKRVLAPLGPTCIYKFRGTKREVTLSVEKEKFSSITRQLKKRKAVTVSHHQAECGTLGQPVLYVSLLHGKVLDIAAGCTQAQQIAKYALSNLP